MSAYLDTHVAIRLAARALDDLSPAAIECTRNNELLLSPMALLEIEYLFELKKVGISAEDVRRKLEGEMGMSVCQRNFHEIAEAALQEKWTRDPFDRLIVANAKVNGFSNLITADRQIREFYPRAVW